MRKPLALAIALSAILAVSAAFPGVFPQVRAQTADPDSSATFEVASVKANKSGDNRIGIGFQPGGRFRATNVPLRELISAAYGTPQPLPAFQITGGPKWIESDKFDIVAKAPGDPQPGPNGPPTVMFAMLRNLLADRFQLALHRENREMPIYALVLARPDGKLGPQLKVSATDCAAMMAAGRGRGTPPPLPQPGERMPCGMRMFPGNLSGGSSSMTQLTNVLARFVQRTVVDQTGLTGNYDLDLQWTPDQMPQGRGDPPPGAPPLPAIDPNGPSIFTAVQEQLGLKLESSKGPVSVVVIDRVEHPTED
jgi:bla regulator protein blaR1